MLGQQRVVEAVVAVRQHGVEGARLYPAATAQAQLTLMNSTGRDLGAWLQGLVLLSCSRLTWSP